MNKISPVPEMDPHHSLPPSPWVERFAALIPAGGRVLDLACGRGRHARLLAGMGYQVEAVDRNDEALATLAGMPGISARQADLEGAAWPLAGCRFDGIVVTNYLYRPRLNDLLDALNPGGVLIYETFMVGQQQFGKPSNPDFLLRSNELLEVVKGRLDILAFEQGRVDAPCPAMMQRICARRLKAAA